MCLVRRCSEIQRHRAAYSDMDVEEGRGLAGTLKKKFKSGQSCAILDAKMALPAEISVLFSAATLQG